VLARSILYSCSSVVLELNRATYLNRDIRSNDSEKGEVWDRDEPAYHDQGAFSRRVGGRGNSALRAAYVGLDLLLKYHCRG
jgi:hypothetical protein